MATVGPGASSHESTRPRRAGASNLPAIVVSGASGFIGRHFLEAARRHYRIFALARRSQKEAGVPVDPNITWIMVDIADEKRLSEEFSEIEADGGADFVLHLAGFYTFDSLDHPEYLRTNVRGTRNMLAQARRLNVSRFVFASSVTVTEFRTSRAPVTERSPADAGFPYARSKAAGEASLREHSRYFPCSVVRLAAVFSDWCEYGPLYMLLSSWFSGGPCCRVVVGQGKASIPYVHISYVVELFLEIFRLGDKLERFGIYVASPSRSHSHRELFELATRIYFGESRKPILVPGSLAVVGLLCRRLRARMVGERMRERLWMLRYVDTSLDVDPSYTLSVLPIRHRRRFALSRRLVFIVENAKSYPAEWDARNAAALRITTDRPALAIANAMRWRSDEILERIFTVLSTHEELPHYRSMDPDRLRWYIQLVYTLLMQSVRNGERMSLLSYGRYLARVRRTEGVAAGELCRALLLTGTVVYESLVEDAALREYAPVINDAVRLTMRLIADEVEDVYDDLTDLPAVGGASGRESTESVDPSREGREPVRHHGVDQGTRNSH